MADSLQTRHVSTHTHLSADDPKDHLLAMAMRENLLIPKRFLDEMQIDYTGLPIEWKQEKTLFFGPKRPEQLAELASLEPKIGLNDLYAIFDEHNRGEEFKRKVIRSFSIPDDEIRDQGGFENVFMLLEFITKHENRDFIKERIVNIATQRMEQENCKYMQLASGSVLKPDYILGWQDAKEALQDKDFQIELKLGIPRQLKPKQMMDMIDRAIAYHERGICCGIDIMGFEDNKTSHFSKPLHYLGEQLKEKGLEKSFVVQVHSGETSKNPDNVNDVLKLALKCGFSVNMGHSLNGWNEETIVLMKKLAEKNQVTVQLLHGSNISLSAVNDLDDVPFKLLADNHIPFVIDTDGGIYGTDYKNLLASLVFAGADTAILTQLAENQEKYYQQRVEYIEKYTPVTLHEINAIEEKLAAHARFTPDVQQRYQQKENALQKTLQRLIIQQGISTQVEDIDNLKKDKAHIMLFGASGRSWNDKSDAVHSTGLSKAMQNEMTIMVAMMAAMLDPDKVTFGVGRTKKSGGAAEALIEALDESKKGFSTVVYPVRASDFKADSPVFTSNTIQALYNLGGGLLGLPEKITKVAAKHSDAIVMLVGGQRTTSDIARLMLANENTKDKVLLMRDEGASGVYAGKITNENLSFGSSKNEGHFISPAEDALRKLHERIPEMFMPHYRQENINAEITGLKLQIEEKLGIQGLTKNYQPDLKSVSVMQPNLKQGTRTLL